MKGQSTLLVHWNLSCSDAPVSIILTFLPHSFTPPLVHRIIVFPGWGSASMLVLPMSAADLYTKRERFKKRGFPGAQASHSYRPNFEPTCFISSLPFCIIVIFLLGLNVFVFHRGLVFCKTIFRVTCAGTFAAATECTGALGYTTHPLVRLAPALSRSPIPLAHALDLVSRCSARCCILERHLTGSKTVDNARVVVFSRQSRKQQNLE